MSTDKHRETMVETRKDLLENLSEVVQESLVKFSKVTVSAKDRRGWARIVISGVSEMGKILKDVELDDLDQRISKLEEMVK